MTTDAEWDAGWTRLMRGVLGKEEFDAAGAIGEWGCAYNGAMSAREASQITRDHRAHPADTCRAKARALGVLQAEGRRVPDSGRVRYGEAVARLAEASSPRHGRAVAHLRRKHR